MWVRVTRCRPIRYRKIRWRGPRGKSAVRLRQETSDKFSSEFLPPVLGNWLIGALHYETYE